MILCHGKLAQPRSEDAGEGAGVEQDTKTKNCTKTEMNIVVEVGNQGGKTGSYKERHFYLGFLSNIFHMT